MLYNQIRKIANGIIMELSPFCERIEIAGSIRRKKPECKDIDIVCIPEQETFKVETETLFGLTMVEYMKPVVGFCDAVNKYEQEIGFPIGKYTRRILPEGIKLELSMCSKETWGMIFTIRTGSANFSKNLMTTLRKRGYKCEDGIISHVRNKNIINIKEEKDLFNLCGLEWIEPEKRN